MGGGVNLSEMPTLISVSPWHMMMYNHSWHYYSNIKYQTMFFFFEFRSILIQKSKNIFGGLVFYRLIFLFNSCDVLCITIHVAKKWHRCFCYTKTWNWLFFGYGIMSRIEKCRLFDWNEIRNGDSQRSTFSFNVYTGKVYTYTQ